jgi:hypothetical protein
MQVGAGLVAVRMRLEGAPESLYCVGRSCISWQLVPVPDGLGEERISEGLTRFLNWKKKNIRLYDKNSESDFFFFLHQNQNILFSNIGNQNIFLEKNHNPPCKLNGRS